MFLVADTLTDANGNAGVVDVELMLPQIGSFTTASFVLRFTSIAATMICKVERSSQALSVSHASFVHQCSSFITRLCVIKLK